MASLAKELNNLDNIWDGVIRLLDKVDRIAEEMEWPELREMVVSQMFDPPAKEPSELLFNQEQFLMRLCCRYETFKKADFNIVVKDKERYRISNYDFNTYVWAKQNGFIDELDNNFIYLPFDKLTSKQREAFDKKAMDNYDKDTRF